MCRLFGLHAGQPVNATFWLLDAPDSLAEQSRRNPDGAGIGVFAPDGEPQVSKQPLAAFDDAEFLSAARSFTATTFVAHVRYASTGGLTEANTHPFLQDGRLFAHNGVLGGLPELDRRLAELGCTDMVGGQTDSERLFTLITGETRQAAGDLGAGIRAAIRWVAHRVPVYSLNFVLTTPGELFALRYPATHDLFVLDRRGAGPDELHAHSRRIRARVPALAHQPAVVVATEVMDRDPRWRLMAPGELLHVDRELRLHTEIAFPQPPSQLMSLADLSPTAAASQHPA